MARLSIDDDALNKLQGYSSQFGTNDPSKLILLLATERDVLSRCVEGHSKPAAIGTPSQTIAPTVASQPSNSGLEELSGLLNS